MELKEQENLFWPKKVTFSEVLVFSWWAFISWFIWSIILLLIVFFSSWVIEIPTNLASDKITFWWNSALFPFILAFITFFVTIIVTFSTYLFYSIIKPTKYKRTSIHFWQLAFFAIFTYIFLTPVYIYLWIFSYSNIMLIFIIHVLFLSFWTSLILEILNNYRYILLWLYAHFLWLILASIIIFVTFFSFETWFAKLVSLLIILPVSNWLITLFKWLFEYLYFVYFKVTWYDQLWDIIHQIEQEEEDELAHVVEENSTYKK